MRKLCIATLLTFAAAVPAMAQQSRASNAFSFDICYNQCLKLGGSPGSCSPGCADRAAHLARIPIGAARSPNDDPRSPRFYDPAPRAPSW